MKKIILFTILSLAGIVSSGQSMLHYEFNNTLEEVNGNGPALTVLGEEGEFLQDTLLEIGSAEKTVYRFAKNSGFRFNNNTANNFLKTSYTIEVYFVFDQLNSWKRVVDWKNRSSDNGAYVYNGQLNFYPHEYSGDAPVHENEYTYYVITRNGETEELIIYTDAVNQIAFTDLNYDALMSMDNLLNFFHDDVVVQNEASSGAVAMLKLYNYRLDSADIAQRYEDLAGNVFSIGENSKESTSIGTFPNPVSDHLTVDLSGFDEDEMVNIMIFNTLGVILGEFDCSTDVQSSISIPVLGLKSGIYILHAESGRQIAVKKIVVK